MLLAAGCRAGEPQVVERAARPLPAVGDTITVAGRVTLGTRDLPTSTGGARVFVQGHWAGGLYFARPTDTVHVGDSVVVVGVVDEYRGARQLREPSMRVIPAPRRAPVARDLAYDSGAIARHDGSLVRMSGQVIDVGRRAAGGFLTLRAGADSSDLIWVFLSPSRRDSIDLARFDIGDHVSVTGVLGRYQPRQAQPRYQLYPRQPEDLRHTRMPTRWYRELAAGAATVLAIATIWVLMLRVQVRRRTRAAVESEARFRTLVRQAPVGVFRVNADLRVEDGNAAFAEVVGSAAGQELTLTDPCVCLTVREALAGREANYEGQCILTPGGEPREVVLRVAPCRDDRGSITAAVGVLEDVTERRRTMAALREREAQLQQVARLDAVGRLAGGTAHDFSNVLTVIGACAASAREQLHAEHAAHAELREIEQAVHQAGALTRQLLAVGRRGEFRPGPTSLGAVVDNLTPMLRRAVGSAVTVDVECDAEMPLIVADRVQIEQALVNLVLNARDAMADGGTVRIVCGVAADGASAFLRVSDTGHGMDEATCRHVFEPFFSTKELGAGTGLGLATVYGIARRHGGTVSVESAPGQGATFTLNFPLLPAARAVAAEQDAALQVAILAGG